MPCSRARAVRAFSVFRPAKPKAIATSIYSSTAGSGIFSDLIHAKASLDWAFSTG